MINFICENTANSTTSIIVYVVLIVMLVAMLILPLFTKRKQNKEYLEMLESMRVGDLVKTGGGIIGKITKITDKGEVKTVVLETGSKSEKSYIELDMSMIYCVLKSTKVDGGSDKQAQDETKSENAQTVEKVEQTEKAEPKAEDKTEEKPAETEAATEKTEPKAKKTAAKKTTTKKTTKKAETK